MPRRCLVGLVVVAMLCGGEPCGAMAQTQPPAETSNDDGGQTGVLAAGMPLLQIGLLVGSAWLGSIVARRFIDSGWFSLIGARLGAGLGLESAASLGLLGIGVGGALPASRVVGPQLISAPPEGDRH